MPGSPRKTVAVIFGTRPDTIKLAPVIIRLRAEEKFFRVVTIATAQHRQMLDQVLDVFKIAPDHDLNIMRPRQTLAEITKNTIEALDHVLGEVRPDMVLVQGDTTTTFVGSLAAFYRQIPVGHVEAGLRTHDKANPFPEEINRRLTSAIADLHFAPTRDGPEGASQGEPPPPLGVRHGKHGHRRAEGLGPQGPPLLRAAPERPLRPEAAGGPDHHAPPRELGEPMAAAARAIRRIAERYTDHLLHASPRELGEPWPRPHVRSGVSPNGIRTT